MLVRFVLCVGLNLFGLSPVLADTVQNRIWFSWEHKASDRNLCEKKKYCTPISKFMTRLVEEPTTSKAEQMVGQMDRLAKSRGKPVEPVDTPTWCQHSNAQTILGFEAETWPMAEKLKALEGLQGVYFSLVGLKGPENYEGAFGPNVQASVARKFNNAGIPVLTKEEMELTPGKPHLNVYFSNTNPDTGCWFSVFSSLSQTMLLTRNHTIKVKAGSWGFSGGYSKDHPDRAEFDAIMVVIDRFIKDFQKANPNGVKNLVKLKP